MNTNSNNHLQSIIRRFIVGAAVGYGYHLLTILTGVYLLHLLPTFSSARAVVYAVVIGIFFAVCEALDRLIGWRISWLLPPVLLSGHFLLWQFYMSGWSVTSLYGGVLTAGLTFGVFLGLLLTMIYFRSAGPAKITTVLIGLMLVMVVQYSVLAYLPASYPLSWLSSTSPRYTTEKARNIQSVLFPFSIPVNRALQSYPFLVPRIPEGKKIFVLVLDAFREDFFGKTMGGQNLTPNLSQLAEENLYFSNYRVQAPWTKASVASFFTGRYLREHATFIGGDREALEKLLKKGKKDSSTENSKWFGHALPKWEVTLAERLDKQNFNNAGFVTIDHINARYQFNQGFDYYEKRVDHFQNGNPEILRRIQFWLLSEKPGKSFVYVHLKGPHIPYRLARKNPSFWQGTRYLTPQGIKPPAWDLPAREITKLVQLELGEDFSRNIEEERRFIRHLYGAELNAYDRFVVPLFTRTLKDLDVWDDTFFVTTSDHGEGIYDHENFYGHGNYIYEEAINVPLVIKPPENLPVNSRIRARQNPAPVESIDLTATLLEYGGANRSQLSGTSFLPLIGKPSGNFSDTLAFAEKTGLERVNKVAVIYRDWKYIYNFREKKGRLYNLARDPGETNPLEGHHVLRTKLTDFIVNRWGPKGAIPGKSTRININKEELEKLKGLGYLN